jgi:ABC-type nitrate/sulfonate/bicarbonate transport system permease component
MSASPTATPVVPARSGALDRDGRGSRLLNERTLLPLAGIVGALALWEVLSLCHFLGLWTTYISDPAGMLSAGWTMATDGELWTNAKGSLSAFAIGFAISAAIGVPVGLLMGWNRTVRELLEPPMMALNALPRLALLPVIVVWLGIGVKSTVVVVVLDAVIPVIVNGMAGIRDVDNKLVRVARSFGANRRQLFGKVLLPASLPAIVTGLRLGVARAVLGVIVAQLYVSTVGIGHLIKTYGETLQVDQITFLVLLVAVFAYLINLVLARFERRFDSWKGLA